MTTSRFTKALISGVAALSLVAGTGVAAADTEPKKENQSKEINVEVVRNGSTEFDLTSSGTGPKGEDRNAKVDSSKNGFTSSTGDKAKEDAEKNKKTTQNKSEGSAEDQTVKIVLIVAGVLAIFAAGHALATQQAMMPR